MHKCLNCKKDFKSLKGLHGHLKVHGGVSTYYQTYFPRYDLFDGSLIEFKNKDQYFETFFNSDENRFDFYNDVKNGNKAKKYLLKEIQLNSDFKKYDFLPSDTYLFLSKLPSIELIRRHFGSCREFCNQSNLKELFGKKLNSEFWNKKDFSDLEVFVDTREQNPFKFQKTISNKLDFGDYTASGDFFKKVFIERKDIGDFASTLSSGINRFEKELKRARDFNSYIVVVVEGRVNDIENHVNKLHKNRRPNLSYALHNARRLLLEFSDNLQIVFCPNRLAAQDFSQRVLYFSDLSKNCDLQYFLNKHYGLV